MIDLKKKIADIGDILTLPDVVSRLNNLVNDPDTSAADITQVISTDIALSAKVLRLVNSPFYGFNRRITSINYAIVILGFNAIRNLALSAFMFDLYRTQIENFDSREFWRFSICCATAAQVVAEKCGDDRCDDAFMAGLLHDIGLVVMSQYFTDDFRRALKLVGEKNCLLIQAERELLDYDHLQVGAALLDTWNLPEEMTSVCVEYYDAPKGCEKLSAIAHVANVFCRALLLGNPGDNQIQPLSPDALDILMISPCAFEDYLRSIALSASRLDSFLQMDSE